MIEGAVRRVQDEACRKAPHLGRRLAAWMRALAGQRAPALYFQSSWTFPMFTLPWWAEEGLRGNPEGSFQADLMYSTVCGYYYIRLVDDIMDEHPGAEPRLLPTSAFLLSAFQRTYTRYFPPGHEFWTTFEGAWFGTAEATIRDSEPSPWNARRFMDVAARKTSAIAIPVTAVCYRNDRADLVRPWQSFCGALGRFAQMADDVFDWQIDSMGPRSSYFLAEGARRKRSTEALPGWVFREGFDWGIEMVLKELGALRKTALGLPCPALAPFVDRWEGQIVAKQRRMAEGLRALSELAEAFPEK